MAEPFAAGATNVTVACALPAVAEAEVGAEGGPAGVTLFERSEGLTSEIPQGDAYELVVVIDETLVQLRREQERFSGRCRAQRIRRQSRRGGGP